MNFKLFFLLCFFSSSILLGQSSPEVEIHLCNENPLLKDKRLYLLAPGRPISSIGDGEKWVFKNLQLKDYELIIEGSNWEVVPSTIDFNDPAFKVNDNCIEISILVKSNAKTIIDDLEPSYQIDNDQILRSSHLRLSQFLQYNLSIFHSTFQTIADFTDHVNPAAMKGLSTDHMLVLVNGVRLHSSSLVNVNRSFGKGSVSYDLDIIPMSSIDKIEVYRTSASMRYGSDAIAGIINILTTKPKNKELSFNGGVNSGGAIPRLEVNDGVGNQYYFNASIPIFNDPTDPCKSSMMLLIGTEFSRLGPLNRSGNYNFQTTGIYVNNDPEGDANKINERDFWNKTGFPEQRVLSAGRAGTDNLSTYFQLSSNDSEDKRGFSIFGNYNKRDGQSSVFYRFPKDVNRGGGSSLYPDGFSPKLLSNIQDYFLGLDAKLFTNKKLIGKLNGSYGINALDMRVNNSINAEFGNDSPTAFYVGGFRYQQGFGSVSFGNNKKDKKLYLLDFGGVYRYEKYEIIKGDTLSRVNKTILNVQTGSQGYPGLNTAVSEERSTLGAYAEFFIRNSDTTLSIKTGGRLEYIIREKVVPIGKLSIKWNPSKDKNLAIRSSYNGGFKAPSLQQSYFTSVSSQTSQSRVRYVTTFNNNDFVLRNQLGLNTTDKKGKTRILKPEYSHTGNLGLEILDTTTSFSLNFYYARIRNRIILSGQIDSTITKEIGSIFKKNNISTAQFFLNAVNTSSFGIDSYISHKFELVDKYQIELSANMFYNISTKIARAKNQTLQEKEDNAIVDLGKNISTTDTLLLYGKEELIFNREEIALLEKGQPSYKFILNLLINRAVGKNGARMELSIHSSTFGGVQYWAPQTETSSRDQYYSSKTLIDTRFAYSFPENKLQLFGGINNLFDTYPDRNLPANTDNNQFLYSRRSPQFDLTGRYFYTGLRLNL